MGLSNRHVFAKGIDRRKCGAKVWRKLFNKENLLFRYRIDNILLRSIATLAQLKVFL